jgi:nucleotide-binding universal stress UspA family protein
MAINEMGNSKTLRTKHLVLDNLVPNVDLARRLPQRVAHQFHALPVAEERGVLTVVMADPDDAAARQAVTTALGTAPYIVQGDKVVIDTWIAQLWAEEAAVRPQYLVYAPEERSTRELHVYACQLGALTRAEVSWLTERDVSAVAERVRSTPCDLVICGQACEPLARRVLCGPTDSQLAECLPTSLLVLANPRWPLHKMLLVILDPNSNGASLAWVHTLAQPAGATVTALAVVPPIPDLYGNLPGMKHDLAQLLATGTPLGKEMRRIAKLLVDWRINGVLRLRQGPPSREVRLEAKEGDYDLIVLCADTQDRLTHLVLGGVVNPLLRWADRPVLIAKSTLVK